MKKICLIIAVGALFLNIFLSAKADVATGMATQGLTISPPLLEITLNPGETYNGVIKLTNPTKNLVEDTVLVENFKAKNETGAPAFSSSLTGEEHFSLASWINFSEKKVALTPAQIINWQYQIQVPRNAEPGGHYGVIFFSNQTASEKQNSQIKNVGMVGSLILVRVPGAISEKANIVEFSTHHFIWRLPENFIVRIANLGNVHFKPQGEIVVKNWRGAEKSKLTVNEDGGNVLPDSIRKFEQQWNGSRWEFGRYRADLHLIYGENGNILSGNIYFWVVPLWLIVAIAILFILIIWFLIRLSRRIAKGRKSKQSRQPVIIR